MGPSSLQSLIEAIHASPVRCVLYIAGAGSCAISHLTAVPGCSRTLLDARVPYSLTAAAEMLEDHPTKMVNTAVARQFAQHAYHNAKRYMNAQTMNISNSNTSNTSESEIIIGIGSTSAVQTNRSRHGKDCAFVAAWNQEEVVEYTVEIPQHLSRTEQEEQVTFLLLKVLAEAASIPFTIPLIVEPTRQSYPIPKSPLQCLFKKEIPCIVFNTHGEVRADLKPYTLETPSVKERNTIIIQKQLLFPGSFSPLHWGHTELARAAIQTVVKMISKDMQSVKKEEMCCTLDEVDENKVQLTYEITIHNADKGVIQSETEIERRIQQFLQIGKRVAVTSARLFSEKATLFPNHGFVVGIDTVKRIFDLKYYENSREAMIESMLFIKSKGGFFVVGGRTVTNGEENTWEDLNSIKVPEELESMFIPISKEDFRVDVSSTELRKNKEKEKV
ncbi:nucleotidyl transferase domain-containing protein [Trypanosoma theileri]|uniref:Nucleotidyl transferase domain-containing protein n=1 Tax=Trypanosoma theileri TaxID=67003 RepID=A0A1X0NWF4_9TRYP|nr:nucleotidyl transferase domain-containing protein [Trypanosoma theileri]ORC89036.1 nucleotidyl transferase domain-containing protein [Trypanosoma theileri]